MTIEADPIYITKIPVGKQRPGESDEFYIRNIEDPLEIAMADETKRREIMGMAKEGMSAALETGNFRDVIEFGTDFAYRGMGLADPKEISIAARSVISSANKLLEDGEKLQPADRLALRMRQLDLVSLQAVNKYKEGKADRDKETERSASKLLEATSRDVIRTSTDILIEAQHTHESIEDEDQKMDLRGKMFELLYTTYLRLEAYEAEEYGDRIVLGATKFEDDAAKRYQPSHNYDVLVMDSDGNTKELVQCKSSENENKAYQPPIVKVSGKAFGNFIRKPETYINALLKVVTNSPTTTEAQMTEAKEYLKALFNQDERESIRQLGIPAVSAGVSV